ncbi:hypothetical protein P3T76_014885 [Phytophthora citrophthora]|uniref:Crinkler (CRN) family protein n=1 Tax=Phytophthora citrophthora TaxID=4793 RepID=A0AAD9G0Q9_9STRA|nr:hypothetical protein P3T76_014883 [Phytophthora citrophthora]KAK1929668.1 hypothetical protein P3T76_014885 [Phytophthora citrophthora]
MNTNALKSDYAAFENMIAHAIFCASRRNGVRGISFNDFFAGLLGELQDKFEPMTMTIAGSSKRIVASDLLHGFPALSSLVNATIPFLAPPNAEWPDPILKADGCNFGHLVRSTGEERCDTYVINVNTPERPLFICDCKYWNEAVGSDNVRNIVGGLEEFWGDKWTIVLLFCVQLENVKNWEQEEIGCVKVTCETHQSPEGKKKKLLVVMEMGTL